MTWSSEDCPAKAVATPVKKGSMAMEVITVVFFGMMIVIYRQRQWSMT